MSRQHTLIQVRRLPGGGWRVWKFYPKVKGSKCWGWIKNDGPDLERLIPFALEGLRSELYRRARVRARQAKSIAEASS
jgi:hypothetical protein